MSIKKTRRKEIHAVKTAKISIPSTRPNKGTNQKNAGNQEENPESANTTKSAINKSHGTRGLSSSEEESALKRLIIDISDGDLEPRKKRSQVRAGQTY